MATAPALHLVDVSLKDPSQETWEALIARYGQAFIAIEAREATTSWDKAQLVRDFDEEVLRHPAMHGKPRHEISKKANMDLRAWLETQRQPAVRPSFLANARKLFATWPDIIAGNNILPYEAYRHMANCNLPRTEKEEVRAWAEETRPLRTELRRAIRARVDAAQGVYRPDFDLKVSNHWVFAADDKRLDGFEGGVNPALYANLIHYFSNPGDTVLDPFAGGGLLAATLKRYTHFQHVTQAEFSGPRYALMADIAPQHPAIVQADARISLPFPDQCAHLAICDPPYLTIAKGKYTELGHVFAEWREGLKAAINQVARCLTPEGILVIMTDDLLRKQQHIPLGYKVVSLLEEEGWQLMTTLYNFNRNFLSMSPVAMAGAKHARFAVNAVKSIQVAVRPTV